MISTIILTHSFIFTTNLFQDKHKKNPVINYSIFIKELVLMLYDKKVEYFFLIFDTIMFLKYFKIIKTRYL